MYLLTHMTRMMSSEFVVFEIKYSPTFLCQGKMADVSAPCYFNNTQFKEDNAVLSDYNHSQAVVIDFELDIMSAKDTTKSAASGVNKLDRTNYLQWTIDVQLFLEEKGFWKFVRGKQVEPLATASAAEREKYEKDKNKSRAIVLQCLVPTLQPAAMKHDTTEAVWTHLKKIFEPSSIAREASLVEEFYSMRRHENEELDSFMAHLDKAEDDIVVANDKLIGIL
uniref:DUF4219 domain-containing protein n=1 Tax=Strigamia maritima TaxID=126957 RepID=T1IMJ2_STRMM